MWVYVDQSRAPGEHAGNDDKHICWDVDGPLLGWLLLTRDERQLQLLTLPGLQTALRSEDGLGDRQLKLKPDAEGNKAHTR